MSAARAVRLVSIAIAGWLVVVALRNALFSGFDAGPLFGRYVHDVVLVLAGAMCVWRAISRTDERRAWGLIGAGVLA